MTRSHGDNVRQLLAEISLFPLNDEMLARALDPFPLAVRTFDGLHLATMDFLLGEGHRLALASYDDRLNAAATALRIPLYTF